WCCTTTADATACPRWPSWMRPDGWWRKSPRAWARLRHNPARTVRRGSREREPRKPKPKPGKDVPRTSRPAPPSARGRLPPLRQRQRPPTADARQDAAHLGPAAAITGPAVRRHCLPLPIGVALAHDEAEAIVPGHAHAQVADDQAAVDVVQAQPAAGKPGQPGIVRRI